VRERWPGPARLLGEMHCTEIGTNEIGLHSTHEVADVHGFDLLGID
jgi:hypothetical protein